MLAWVAYACILGAGFAAAAWALERVLAAHRLAIRWVWIGAILSSLGAPLAAYLAPASTMGVALIPAAELLRFEAGFGAVPGSSPFLTRLESVFPYLWLGVTTMIGAWLTWSGWRLDRQRRAWQVRKIEGTDVLESQTVGPAVIGVFGTVIAVPTWLSELDEEFQRLVILHESEHRGRRDPLLLWGGWLACTAAPWNPALWWQLRRLRLAIEIDCDHRVLAHGVSPHRYGRLLLEVGRRVAIRPLTTVGLFEGQSFLERRIRAMTRHTSRHRAIPLTIAALLAVVLVGAFMLETPIPARPLRSDAVPYSPRQAEFIVADGVTPAVQDTDRFMFTPYTVKPRCIEGCTPEALVPHFESVAARLACDVVIGIRIDTMGAVTATDLLKPSYDACNEAARAWASTTRWSPGEMDDRPVAVWMAQPVSYRPEDAS